MNNLIITCLAVGAAGVLWLGQRNSVQAARISQRALHQELAAARATLAEASVATTNAQELLASRQQELASARSEALPAASPVKLVPPDVAGDGLWPKDKPYCYVSKQHLSTIGFIPFSEEGALTSEAATLFGMSPTEQAAVDRAYNEFLEGTHQLHLGYVDRLEAKPGVNTDNHREITYRIPALTNEFRQVRAALSASLEATLGKSRADVLFKRAKEQINNAYGQYGNNGYTLKFSADRQPDGSVKHHLRTETLDGRSSNGYGIRFPIEPSSGLWKYRHILSDQPLLQ